MNDYTYFQQIILDLEGQRMHITMSMFISFLVVDWERFPESLGKFYETSFNTEG